MTTTKKPAYNLIKVLQDDGTYVQVKRCNAANLEEFLELMEALVKEYIICEGSISLLLVNPEMVSNLETLCSLLPIVSKSEEQAYLDFDKIKENWEQLVQLFFNKDLNSDTRETKALEAGKIAAMHFFPHIQTVQKAVKEMKKKRELEEERENSAN